MVVTAVTMTMMTTMKPRRAVAVVVLRSTQQSTNTGGERTGRMGANNGNGQ